MGKNLSKSRILSGLQCIKRLWLEIYKPELLEVTDDMQRRFDTGHQVGGIAQEMFPGGHLIEHDQNLSEAIKETASLLKDKPDVPLFEATFSAGGVLIRADVLLKSGSGYRVIEVKASTSVKDYYLSDCAVQTWVVENAGYKNSQVDLAHVDKTFVYPGGGDYNGLLHYEDITERIQPLKVQVPEWISRFRTVLDGDMPDIEVGPHCSDPYGCPFIDYCTPENFPEYPVSILPYGGKLIDELMEDGYEDIRDVPDGRLVKPVHERVRTATITGEPYIDPAMCETLRNLPYPRFYLDFETAQFPIPTWAGTRPYQQLPVQWSCHIEKSDGTITHEKFLDLTGNPPMEEFIKKLIVTVGDSGPIIVYSHFEKTILKKQMAEMHPDYAHQIEEIINRLFDLYPVMKAGYYHPKMKGSWSIKGVLPCVAPELKYDALDEIHAGGDAQAAYLEAIHPDTTPDRKNELHERLTEYCSLDTMSLVKIVECFSALHV